MNGLTKFWFCLRTWTSRSQEDSPLLSPPVEEHHPQTEDAAEKMSAHLLKKMAFRWRKRSRLPLRRLSRPAHAFLSPFFQEVSVPGGAGLRRPGGGKAGAAERISSAGGRLRPSLSGDAAQRRLGGRKGRRKDGWMDEWKEDQPSPSADDTPPSALHRIRQLWETENKLQTFPSTDTGVGMQKEPRCYGNAEALSLHLLVGPEKAFLLF